MMVLFGWGCGGCSAPAMARISVTVIVMVSANLVTSGAYYNDGFYLAGGAQWQEFQLQSCAHRNCQNCSDEMMEGSIIQ